MSIPTIAPAGLGDDQPTDLVLYSIGLADAYDDDRAGTAPAVLAARVAVMRRHLGQAGPDFTTYLDGYADAVDALIAIQQAETAAQIQIAYEDHQEHR